MLIQPNQNAWRPELSDNFDTSKIKLEDPHGYRALRQYQRPSVWKASWQLANTLVPYLLLCLLMLLVLRAGVSYVFVLGLAVVAAALLVRIFIFLHDCAHHCRAALIINYPKSCNGLRAISGCTMFITCVRGFPIIICSGVTTKCLL